MTTETEATEQLRKNLASGANKNWTPNDYDLLIKELASEHARPDETEAQAYTRARENKVGDRSHKGADFMPRRDREPIEAIGTRSIRGVARGRRAPRLRQPGAGHKRRRRASPPRPAAINSLDHGAVSVSVRISAVGGGCVKTQMRDRRMVGRLAVSDCRISTDLLRSMRF